MKILEINQEMEQILALIFDVALKSKGMEVRALINKVDATIKVVDEEKSE